MINWHDVFQPSLGIAEVVLRGTLMYLVLFVILRFIARRQAGYFGPADLLVIGRFGLHPSRRHDSTVDHVIELVTCPTLVIGLAGRVVDPRQCPRCVAVREDSDGERWFCDAHRSPEGLDLVLRLPPSTRSVQGGPLL